MRIGQTNRLISRQGEMLEVWTSKCRGIDEPPNSLTDGVGNLGNIRNDTCERAI